ncbi:hypothetical protein BDN70DRAFT_933985 [Pholiota conissans]|uniref:Uncharacterized protein n=1 Tax=Pholiota conissans TaxID=109636 RepID=A0A9P5YZU8_9AGAR|nr:hypothetical protein BDN70DRAFT_933985 [Pholiota conissans]
MGLAWKDKLMRSHGGIELLQGQASHFIHAAPAHVPHARHRLVEETRRLNGVLDTHLKDSDFIVSSRKV